MAETEHITVATTSPGPGGTDDPGNAVDLPVVELLTGRGFVTGKSGSGKSNTASVIAEKLLDNGFGMLIVDIDGEYYGLKEEYEILHAGADDECDIQVTAEHAEKIAGLALEQNVPIILDISSFLDQDEASELLKEVARHLFAKAKKQKQPFLMLVEECHEWIPENGSVGEVGQMLIKIGKRGRKHGLGMVGISQRPADVKKDYITQCDWLVWHRLTWNNDTKVVGRIIDSEYADAVEDLNDGEAFLMTDWAETIRRVQFHRKQTFDAGATPGLDDFERPELKSVSDDLVSELSNISEEKQETEDRIAELREELDKKNSRIAELETELQDARNLSRMAEQFTDALLEHVEGYNPGRTEKGKQRTLRDRWQEDDSEEATGASDGEATATNGGEATAANDGETPATSDEEATTVSDGGATAAASNGAGDEPSTDDTSGGGFGDEFGMFADDGPAMAGGEGESVASNGVDTISTADDDGPDSTAVGNDDDSASTDDDDADVPTTSSGKDDSAETMTIDTVTIEPQGAGDDTVDPDSTQPITERAGSGGAVGIEKVSTRSSNATPQFLRDLQSDIAEMDEKTRRMLAYYIDQGPDTPLNTHFSAGGSGDRTNAYAHNRTLRTASFIEHVGRGRYDATLADLVAEEAPEELSSEEIGEIVDDLRALIESAGE